MTPRMLERQVTITVRGGAHARPVADLVRLALEHAHPITLRTLDGSAADLTSVLAVMDLGLDEGDEVTLQTVRTTGAAAVLDALAAVLAPTR